MQPIAGYLYKQNITVIKNIDLGLYKENQLVYAKPLQLYKGIDNKFQLIIRNAEQKPVRLLDHTVIFNLVDPTARELVFSRRLLVQYNYKGVATTTIEAPLLGDLRPGLYHYSVVVINPENEQEVVYSDDNYQSQGQARLHESIYGAFVPSVKPTILPYHNNSDTNYHNVAFTDVIPTDSRTKSRAVYQTVHYNCTGFTGTIEAQATLNTDATSLPSTWFVAQSATLTDFTGNDYFTFQGKYNSVRFKITKQNGDVGYILYRP